MERLFDQSHEIQHAFPDRPLGGLSTYVVDTMSSDLTAIQTGKSGVASLVTVGEELALGCIPRLEDILAHKQPRDLAGLDAKILEAAVVHSGGVPGSHLAELVDRLSAVTGIPAGITYEDLIFINPLEDDPRTFSEGLVKASERDFYLGHRLIERKFSSIVRACGDAAIRLIEEGQFGVDAASSLLQAAAREFDGVIDYVGAIGLDMPKDHFAVFRPYLAGNPQRGIKGPSGLYTSGIPTLDFLLGGIQMEREYPNLDQDLGYYPRFGQSDIQKARQVASSGNAISDLIRALGDPQSLVDGLEQVSSAVRQFRGMHYKGVRHQIPQALTDDIVGTGGEQSPGAFLRSRQKIRYGQKGSI